MPFAFPDPAWVQDMLKILLAGVIGWLILGLPRFLRALQNSGRPGGRGDDTAEREEAASLERTREEFTAFRLEVARTYVPLSLIRDVDQRLTQHLLRIEQKLDEATRASILAAARVAVLEDDRK